MQLKNFESDDLSNLLDLGLQNLNYSTEKITHYVFLIEEALMKWKAELDPLSELTFRREDTDRDVVFNFSLKERKVDPFSKEALAEFDRPIRSMHDRLLSGIGSELTYRYRNGMNCIILRLPKTGVDDTLFKRTAISLIIPFALQILVQNIASNVDILMLGFLSSDAMSGVSFASQIVFLHTFMIMAVSSAVTSLISQLWSKRRGSSAVYAFRVAVIFSSALCLLEFILCFCFPEKLMSLYTDIPELITQGGRYLKIVSFSFLFDSFYAIFYAFLRVLGERTVVTKLIVWGCVVNVLLNLFLIFGFCGLPRMGASGAAVATLVSVLFQFVFAALYYVRNRKYYCSDAVVNRNDKENIRKVFFSNAVPIFLQYGVFIVGVNFCTAAIGRMNADIIAAYSFINAINAHLLCAKEGCAQASGILNGIQLGNNQFEEAKHNQRLLNGIGYKIGTAVVLLLFVIVFVGQCLPVKLTPLAKQYLLPFTLIIGLNSFCGFQTGIDNGALYSGGQARALFYIDLVNTLLVCIPVSLLSIKTGCFAPILLIFLCKSNELLIILPKKWCVRQGKWLKNMVEKS